MARKSGGYGTKIVFVILLLGAIGGGIYWYVNRKNAKPVEFRTAKIGRGDITQTVTANGQLAAVNNVQVGSQISGIITEINVDFNSKVKKDQVIAKIDPSTYERNLAQVDAELANATAALELTKFEYKKAKELFESKLVSESDYTKAEVGFHQAEAVVKMRQANVDRAKVDLERTIITAPIDGIVITRNIEVGQTVAASFNTPTLFFIANDLAKMQIEAAVSEADVGGVEDGQPVNFTVEAFIRQFRGQVKQIRYAPVTNQNVVTYTAIVEVDNGDLKLRPGMTATASIITAQKRDTLRIPNSAFRFRPLEGMAVKTNAPSAAPASGVRSTNGAPAGSSSELPTPPWRAERRRPTPEEQEKYEASLTPEQKEQYQRLRARFMQGGGGGGAGGEGGGRGGSGAPSASRANQEGPRSQTIYMLDSTGGTASGNQPLLVPVVIRTGITDGTHTEVLEGLKEGDVVVTGVVSQEPLTSAPRPGGFGGGGGSPFGGGGGGRRF
jgi:HlyD family secretion protein